jgi:hypothetical protein
MARVLLAVAAASLALAACASLPPPQGEVANADLALRKAEAVNAAEVAPLDARLAREKLQSAQLAMQKGRHLEARRDAEQAEVDALVASARARSARAQRAEEEIRRDIEALRSEAERAANR